MADVYSTTQTLPNLVTEAYDRYMRLALRSVPQFRAFADTRAVQQTHPGDAVTFSIYSDLADATTPFNPTGNPRTGDGNTVPGEVADPEAVAIPDPDRVSVILEEYGNYTVLTKRLEAFSLDAALDTNAANIIAYNLASSIDVIVQNKLDETKNVIAEVKYDPGSGEENTLVESDSSTGVLKDPEGNDVSVDDIDADSTAGARDFRYAVTKLRSHNVVPARGSLYGAVVHPHVAHDIRVETGSAGWRSPHEYVDTANIYAGEIGTFEGAFFVETPRAFKVDNDDSIPVYNSYVFGREALAEAVASEFGVVVGGTIADPLNRKMALGWTGIAGWELFRTADNNNGVGAMYKINTAASVN